jgi:large subunit ribosomal protein L35
LPEGKKPPVPKRNQIAVYGLRIISNKQEQIMPKLKTRKALKKRIKITKTGKVKVKKPFSGHLLTHKSRKRKRHLKKKTVLTRTDAAKLRAMIFA